METKIVRKQIVNILKDNIPVKPKTNMNKINTFLIVLSLLIFNGQKIWAQGATCANATPFCTAVGTPFSYPNVHNGSTGQSGPSYGCVSTQPDPNWFYLESTSAGTFNFTISQSNGDVDFVAWGPFSTAAFPAACNNLNGGCGGDHETVSRCWAE